MEIIKNLRDATWKGVGDHRIELADNLILTNSKLQ